MSLSLAIAAALILATASMASAAPSLKVSTLAPDHVTPGKMMYMIVSVQNTGTAPLQGNVTVRYVLPPGIPATDAVSDGNVSLQCQTASQVTQCTGDATAFQPGSQFRLRTVTVVDPNASGTLAGEVSVSNDATSEVVTEPLSFDVGPTGPFEIKAFNVMMSDPLTMPAARAGSDPTDITTDVRLLSEAQTNLDFPNSNLVVIAPKESFRDIVVHVPPGFVGNPTATPLRCTPPQLTTQALPIQISTCPPESQIGLVQLNAQDIVPLYNVVPPRGTPAAFGFFYNSIIVTLKARVRPSDNGIDIVTEKSPSSIPIPKFSVTLWGSPSDRSHDQLRAFCLDGGFGFTAKNGDCALRTRSTIPFLRTPTSCPGTPLRWDIEMDTYQHPGTFVHASTTTPPIQGCESNPFEPSLSLTPSTGAPHAPAGVDATVSMPQDWGVNGIAPADLKAATVTLAPGMTINPSSADGLAACGDAELGLGLPGAAGCPEASKLGTLTLRTPLLDHPVAGNIFLRTQNSGDPLSGEMYRIALELRSDDDGIDIKLPGAIRADPVTGRLTTIFDDLPQLPFESMTLHFKTGPRAPLVTPASCGTYSTHSELTSWGSGTLSSDSPFQISADGNGAPCPAPSFAPSLTAGTTTPIAGAFTPFSLRLTRSDEDGQFASLSSLSLPSGLLADVSSVSTRCTDAQADAAACPAASHIGEVSVGAGAGSNPFYAGGEVYLTNSYKGNPFGAAVIVHAQAGPFDLGYVVVKGAIQIHDDGSVTVATDPFPTILQGIPLQVRDIRVNLDRPGFTFNPTSCKPTSINGTVVSTANQQAGVSSRFQVGECANLAFKPKFSASTAGKTSKANGASFHVHLASNEGPHGAGSAGESNIAKVDVQLPVSLPARLTTLQKACTAAQFASNPAGCPAASFVGSATAHTPILASPLSGPAILVSHGGQAFPDLVLVLQGEGVRINLTGHTQIKKGITFSHFETVPDAPVASFDLTLPQGPHSALTTDVPGRYLCATTRTVTVTKRVTRRVNGRNRKVKVKAKKAVSASLLMPTTLTAQNGAVVHQNTKIAVTGCGAVKAKASKKKGKAGR
jgi:hypothetical protein